MPKTTKLVVIYSSDGDGGMPKQTKLVVIYSSDDDDGDDGGALSMPRRKRRKKLSKAKAKEDRQANAQSEVAQGAQARKERKWNKAKAKKSARASPRDDVSATVEEGAPILGFCDVCQGSEKYKKSLMKLWRCKDCSVLVHDFCYGASDELLNKPNPGFRCWACQAVGQTRKVRERDAFTGEYLEIKQKERPRECCLCDVDDGVHAMHPVFDCHGPRGRQILLPADPKERKPRRLAWAHTLCAFTVNNSNESTGALYGCANNGFCEDESDCSLLSDSESVNSELMGKPGSGTHHIIFWGHLHSFLGIPFHQQDDWAKSVATVKKDLRCNICGKNDKEKAKLPGGQTVFQTLRVPVQCCANNSNEAEMFKQYHESSEACYGAFHVGCALWGRNDEGEYKRARSCWFIPGLNVTAGGNLEMPVVEVFCQCHAEELFRQNLEGSDMAGKLPGPCVHIQGTPQKQKGAKPRTSPQRSTTVTSGGSTARTSISVARSGTSPEQARRSINVVSAPNILRPPPTRVAARPAEARPRKPAPHSKVAIGSNKATPLLHTISLHGETKKKRAKEQNKSGEAVMIQTPKQGRLVAKRTGSGSLEETTSTTRQPHQNPEANASAVQDILRRLDKRAKECIQMGKSFDTPARAILRVQLYKLFRETKVEVDFAEAWAKANQAFNNGLVGSTERQKDAGESEKDLHIQSGYSVPRSDGIHQTQNDSTVQPEDKEGTQKDAVSRQHRDTSESLDPGDDCSAGDSLKGASVDDKAELVETIVNDISNAIRSSGQTELADRDDAELRKILQERRRHWRKQCGQSGLSRADFMAMFRRDVIPRLEAKYDWLQISDRDDNENRQAIEASGSSSTEQMGKGMGPGNSAIQMGAFPVNEPSDEEDSAVASPNEEPAPDAPDVSTDAASDKANADNLEYQSFVQDKNVSSPGDDNPHQLVLLHPQMPSNPPSRWSYLYYGPHYRKEGYQFGDWDTYEEIDKVSGGAD